MYDVACVLARHRRLSAGIFLASLLITALAAWLVPRSYRSESKLFVRLGRENASLDPTATIGRASEAAPPNGRENEINSVTEVLQSRALLERVVDAIGPQPILSGTDPGEGPSPASAETAESRQAPLSQQTVSLAPDLEWPRSLSPRDRAIIKLQETVLVAPVKKSDVVRITCDSRNPHLAQKVVSDLVDIYLAEHLRLNRTQGAHEFLEHETAGIRKQLSATEEKLRQLKDKTGVASPESQRELMVSRAARIEDELLTDSATLASTEAEVRQLRQKLATLPATTTAARMDGIPNHGVELMRNELYRVQMLEQEAASKFTEEHFSLKQARQRAAEAKKAYDEEEKTHNQVTVGPNPLYEQTQLALLKAEPPLTSLRAKADSLRSQLADVRDEIKRFNADELEIARLARDLKLQETNYQAYADHLEQARIDDALELQRISNINVVQPATFEPKPVSPRMSLILCLGVMFGLLGAVGLPLIVDSFGDSLKTPRDVENHLGLPVLASLPRFRSEQLSSGVSGNGGSGIVGLDNGGSGNGTSHESGNGSGNGKTR